jgi:UDP-glucose 4-epimerase
MENVLVTGANGFIGQVLARKLQAMGINVRRAVRKSVDNQEDNSITLDLTADWTSNPCAGVDTVFHLAGKAHALSEIAADDLDYQRINTYGTIKLLEAAKAANVQRFIFFSSVKAVLDRKTLQDETNLVASDTPYGLSKRAAEVYVLNGSYVPHSVVIRPCMVYGNTEKGNLPRMISAIERGFFPPLPEMENRRSMVHVDDVVTAAILAAQHPNAAGQIYIVSDGQTYSTRQLYEFICAALNKKPFPIKMPILLLKGLAKVGDTIGQMRGRRFLFDSDALEKLIGSAHYSNAKIETELGFKAQQHLQNALPEMLRYLKSHAH